MRNKLVRTILAATGFVITLAALTKCSSPLIEVNQPIYNSVPAPLSAPLEPGSTTDSTAPKPIPYALPPQQYPLPIPEQYPPRTPAIPYPLVLPPLASAEPLPRESQSPQSPPYGAQPSPRPQMPSIISDFRGFGVIDEGDPLILNPYVVAAGFDDIDGDGDPDTWRIYSNGRTIAIENTLFENSPCD